MSNLLIQFQTDKKGALADFSCTEAVSNARDLRNVVEQPTQKQQNLNITDFFSSFTAVESVEKPAENEEKLYYMKATYGTKKNICYRITTKELKENPSNEKIDVQLKPWIERYDEFRKKLFKVVPETTACTLEETKEKALEKLVSKLTSDIKQLQLNFGRMNMTLVKSVNEHASETFVEATENNGDFTPPFYTYSISLKDKVEAVKENVPLNEEPIVKSSDGYKFKEVYTLDQGEPMVKSSDGYEFEEVYTLDQGESEKLCDLCGRSFKKGIRFQKHMAQHFNEEPLKCKICKAGFAKMSALRNHFKNCHAKKKSRFICSICDMGYRSKILYTRHMDMHKLPSAYLCEYCLAYFKCKSSYNMHLYKHGVLLNSLKKSVDYQCDFCGRIFRSLSALNSHREIHTGEYSYWCNICDKGFHLKAKLKWHMDIHLDVKRFSCDVCHKKFRMRSALNKHHNQIHLNIRKEYKCVVCEHVTGSRQYLKFHMNTHTGDTPFKCKFCPKSFARPSTLYTHMRIHQPEKAKPCSLCGKKFIHLLSLRNHMLMHYGVKRYECNLCDKKFVKKISITKHMERHAKEQAEHK